jgi:hypothetical protein
VPAAAARELSRSLRSAPATHASLVATADSACSILL